jgi:hypothetical protein
MKCSAKNCCEKNCFYFILVESPVITDIESLQNRLLKVCYVPATSAGLNRLFFSFFAAAINSANEANKAGSTCC